MAVYVNRCRLSPLGYRVPYGALSRLEPCAAKVACSVLRGRGGGNAAPLPDPPGVKRASIT